MITFTESIPKAVDVWFNETMLFVRLEDGREVGVPLDWFPLLLEATTAERGNWRFIGNGEGVHWEDIDEAISIKWLIQGGKRNV